MRMKLADELILSNLSGMHLFVFLHLSSVLVFLKDTLVNRISCKIALNLGKKSYFLNQAFTFIDNFLIVVS